jgi:hypothetical protein
MRCVFSLLALGITIALAAAQPVLTLTSIKALDSAKENKDQWSVKGYLSDPDADVVSGIAEFGLDAELQDAALDPLDGTAFDVNECKALPNDKGITCKTTGARFSVRKTNDVPKDAILAAQKAHNKTSHSASSYYKVSGVFRRQQFEEDPVLTPLTVVFSIGSNSLFTTNTACTERAGGRTTRYYCRPGTAAPTRAPTNAPVIG